MRNHISPNIFRTHLDPRQTSFSSLSHLRSHLFSKGFSSSSFSSPESSEISISNLVDHASLLLPHQGILENFVHHNPLEHFQSMKFKDALEYVEKLELYRSPGDRAASIVQVDPRERVKEALVDLSSAFLDRGAAKWVSSDREKGFLYFFASLENLGFAPWRKFARREAKIILKNLREDVNDSKSVSESVLKDNLLFFGIPQEDWEACIRSMVLELRGWAGMFARMESHPSEAPSKTKVKLLEFCAVQSILVRSSITAMASHSGWDEKKETFSKWLEQEPKMKKSKKANSFHASAIAYVDQSAERQEALEKEFEKSLLRAIGASPTPQNSTQASTGRPVLQLFTCIDDRECSLRRHVESTNPEIETYGLAGFFGIPIVYQPSDGRDQMILAPEGQKPSAVLIEGEDKTDISTEKYKRRRKFLAYLNLLWEKASFSPMGSIFLTFFFPLSMIRLIGIGFFPFLKFSIKSNFIQTFIPKPKTDFQLPFPPEQAASMLARTFKDIGIHNRFAPIVVVLGHGSISVNNPFAAAYNCGACGGREGGPNARLLARLANNKEVRDILLKVHNIQVPKDTVFVGGLHNTTADLVEFYDTELLPETHKSMFMQIERIIEQARGKNAIERCHRFLLANHINTPHEALRHVLIRANDLAEVRPELNHATNAAVIVGRRLLSKKRFLDRRVFLPSYDPYSDDDQGTNLEHVLGPALVVCSGINLEYLFSTIDDRHGAGTKVPLNVVGNIAVLQGTTGDLRPGLPTQMTEMHTPIRALYIIDAPIKRVEAVLSRREDLRHLVRNEWVKLCVRDPETGTFYRQTHGEYVQVNIEKKANRFIQFNHHRTHAINITNYEDILYTTALTSMVLACVLPITLFGEHSMNPYGSMIAISGTLLSLPVLAFARRYLHGEFMFGRFASLSVALVSGFNIVATATNLEQVLGGWSLIGFASTFLIGAYNDRPTVRNNATFAFGAYQISDLSMLVAATFASHGLVEHPHIVAAALIIASIYKSSQFPLTSLFARSMEGPTPASALGYAGLSAHCGIVLLTSTMPLWFEFEWARIALGSVGLLTTCYATLVSKIRSERKGAIANATSATIGLIYFAISLGYGKLALIFSLGHASYRMIQILRAPNVISDFQRLKSALGSEVTAQKLVPNWLYQICWSLRRVDIDFTLMYVLQRILSRSLQMPKTWKLTKLEQWMMTGTCVVLAGAPYTPVYHLIEQTVINLLPTQPYFAALFMASYFGVSVALIRFLFLNVLDKNRFDNNNSNNNISQNTQTYEHDESLEQIAVNISKPTTITTTTPPPPSSSTHETSCSLDPHHPFHRH